MTRESRSYPELQREIEVPRFLWELLPNWQALKHENKVTDEFWAEQTSRLKTFDDKHLNKFRPTGIILEKVAPPAKLPVMEQPAPSVVRYHSPLRATLAVPLAASSSKPASKKPASTQPAPKQPALKPPASNKLASKQPATTQPAATTPVLREPATKAPASNKPALVVPEQASIRVRHQRGPVDVKGKGKARAEEPEEEWEEDEVNESDEGSASPSLPPPSRIRNVPVPRVDPPRKDKGKGKMVSADEREDSSEDGRRKKTPAPPASRKRTYPRSNGILKEPACRRCIRTGRACYQRLGTGPACLNCNKIKMKCDSMSDNEDVQVSAPAPPKKPAARSKKPVLSQKPAPTQPSVPAKRSAPLDEAGPSQKRPNRGPVPDAGSKRRKVVKTPAMVDSSDAADVNRPSTPVPAAVFDSRGRIEKAERKCLVYILF